jgi:hypothetical protein
MQGQDHNESKDSETEISQHILYQPEHSQPLVETNEPVEEYERLPDEKLSPVDSTGIHDTKNVPKNSDFDWLAIAAISVIAAIFAAIARLNAQPATSLTPIAVLSATGCGLLITAMRKMRTSSGAGLLEAGIGGCIVAVFQFIAAISYPNVLSLLGSVADERAGFLTTWLVILLLSIIFSVAGAAVGHLAFAPLRLLPIKTETDQNAREEEAEHKPLYEEEEDAEQAQEDAIAEAEITAPAPLPATPKITFLSYVVAVLLLGLAPTLVGIVFSAIFDYMLGINHFLAGPYPTLRLLSALLPWQVAFPFNPGSGVTASLIVLEELWRIPLFLGNPSMFDVQALEPLVINGAALALLLLTLRLQPQNLREKTATPPWLAYLALEVIFGLLLVLPADLFTMRGLQGLLRTPLIAIPIRPLFLLNNLTFALNLISGPVICLILAVVLRLLFEKRAQRRKA